MPSGMTGGARAVALSMHLLDDAIGAALRTRHSSLALVDGGAARYPTDVAPFASLGLSPTADDWEALGRLAPTGAVAMFVEKGFHPAPGWETLQEIGLTQMVDTGVTPPDEAFDEAQDLGEQHVPEMLRLTTLTAPGPFERRTIEFGGYRGVVGADGRLLAMAGRRLAPEGWVEVSAVCTDPEARGRGYARRLMLDVIRGIRADGDRAFLHVAEGNPARGLYESMGFEARADLKVSVLARS
ncbi:GNAT family N-acetyltransferase [Frondihabitans australicus]|uniref:FR47-like protein n=1 Tax=Frondihabitans australicus TaxID=386892 RepID=A0A495IN00_9MICO|nr:GNAT family N-acetyltransferase [Frondihabitans australicus]RKR76495.1 FR47-like protein [Frondihabitans australicus]